MHYRKIYYFSFFCVITKFSITSNLPSKDHSSLLWYILKQYLIWINTLSTVTLISLLLTTSYSSNSSKNTLQSLIGLLDRARLILSNNIIHVFIVPPPAPFNNTHSTWHNAVPNIAPPHHHHQTCAVAPVKLTNQHFRWDYLFAFSTTTNDFMSWADLSRAVQCNCLHSKFPFSLFTKTRYWMKQFSVSGLFCDETTLI